MSLALTASLSLAWRRHWRYYLAEAAGLAFFITCASLLTVALEHPASPLRQASFAQSQLLRRVLMGFAMGLVIFAIVYSPWGKRSGAHINPAVTLAFWQLGKIQAVDALWYVVAQMMGGITAAFTLKLLLGSYYAHPAVNFVVTQPQSGGTAVAFVAEFVISFVLMLALLFALHSAKLKKAAGVLVGLLLMAYIIWESPYSGMSLNPARSLASALAAGEFFGLWVYLLAPPAAMWLATLLFFYLHQAQSLPCAILAGCAPSPASPHSPDEAEPPQYPDTYAD
jgi:aquaporin Z